MNKMKRRSSKIWDFYKDTDKSGSALCLKCKKKISYKNTMTNLYMHMRRNHNIDYTNKFKCDEMDREYKQVPSRKGGMHKSALWEYFTKISGSEKLAMCNMCLRKLSYKTTSTNLKFHLRNKHVDQFNALENKRMNSYEILETEETEAFSETQNYNNSENESFLILVNESSPQDETETTVSPYEPTRDLFSIKTEPGHDPNEKNTIRIPSITVSRSNKGEIDAKLMRFMIRTLLSYSIVDNEEFTNFVESLNPNYIMPTSKDITETMLPSLYDKCMNNIKTLIRNEASVVSLSIDFWTTVNEDDYMSLTIHFITNAYQPKNVLIKCCKIRRNDSQHIFSTIEQTLNLWDLEDKVTACIVENSPELVSSLQDFGVKHYGSIADQLYSCLQHAMDTLDDLIFKVKKLVSYYTNSNKAKELLENYQISKKSESILPLIEASSNRWDSTFLMIERLIKLEDAVKATMPDSYSNLPKILDKEWTAMKQLTIILKPFEIAFKELSTDKFVSGSKAVAVITGLNSIITDVLTKKTQIFDKIDGVVQVLRSEMEKKFGRIECDGNLPLCAVLDPRFKLDIFSKEDIMEKIKQDLIGSVEALIRKDSEGQIVTGSELEESDDEFSIWRHLNKAKKLKTSVNSDVRYNAIQEVENYLNDSSGNRKCNPYTWWMQNNSKYPQLAILFRKTCHLPASSVQYNSDNNLLQYRKYLPIEKGEQLIFLNANLDYVDFEN